ncbi:Uncharacterised protein [Zhongshania aliphaticivorans]|nr:Uncharacterised protein [Zhongshania aliphaticivorans]
MVELVSIDCQGDTARLALRARATSPASSEITTHCVLASAVSQLAQQAGVRRIIISRNSQSAKR